ncbi:MAG: hypothetical protein GF418_06600 [Chitinivibrionales bacterium]|nr:hypothetical protein [Chitinivibrionales bacterium]MBD3395280.1 hypothetical protein [Chitinivibrionales bacterium]
MPYTLNRYQKKGGRMFLHIRATLWRVVSFAVFASLSCFAAEYYVATGGDDADNGSANSPFATIRNAASVAGQGDVVYIRPGVYNEHNDSLVNPGITFESVERHGAVIDGQGQEGPCLKVMVDGITFRGMVIRNAQAQNYSAVLIMTGNGCTIEDCIIEQSGQEANGVSFSAHDVTATDVTVLRTIIQDNIAGGLWSWMDGTDYVIKDCILRRNNLGGFALSDHGAPFKILGSDNVLIDGVISYDNTGTGIWMDAHNSNFTIQNCTSFGNHCQSSTCGDETGKNCSPSCCGMMSEHNPGPGLFKNNVVYRNCHTGIHVAESQNITVEDNVFFENGFWDINIRCCCAEQGREAIHDCIFRNNLVSETADVETECPPWADNPSYNLTWENTQTITSIPAPLVTVTCQDNSSGQITGVVEEETTIDDAIAGAAVGDEVTIPVFGRKAIVESGDQWITEAYDLNCRYVKIFMNADGKTALESVQPFAAIEPADVTVTLEKKEEYAVWATAGEGAVAMREACRGGRRRGLTARLTAGRIVVNTDGTGFHAVELLTVQGRMLRRSKLRKPGARVIDVRGLPSGLYVLRMTGRFGTLARQVSIL